MALLSSPHLAPAELAHRLEGHIRSRTGRRVSGLQVEVLTDKVVLRGRTTTFYVKQLAQHCVWDLMPEARLENYLVVDGRLESGDA